MIVAPIVAPLEVTALDPSPLTVGERSVVKVMSGPVVTPAALVATTS